MIDAFQSISSALRRKAAAARGLAAARHLAGLVILALLLAATGAGLGLLVPVTGVVFHFFTLGSWGLLILGAAAVLRRLARPFGAEEAARLLEARHPDLKGELVSALQLGRGRQYHTGTLGVSGDMIDALEERVAGRLPEVMARPAAESRALLRELALLAAVLAITVGVSLLPGSPWQRALAVMADPFGRDPFASPYVAVEPGDALLLEGEPLTVTARLSGRVSGPLRLETRASGAEAAPDSLPMEALDPSTHRRVVKTVPGSLDYRVTHAKTVTRWFTVRTTPVPRVADIAVTLVPPSYAGLATERVEGTGHLRCLKGTIARWSGRANKPLAEASLVMAGGETHPLAVSEGTSVSGEFVVTGGGRYRVVLGDREGFAPPRPDEYDITLIPDEFPAVDLLQPAADLEVDAGGLVEVVFAGRDDFGLGRASLVWGRPDGRTGRVPLPDGAGRRVYQAAAGWDLGGLELEPGEEVVFHVEVLDNDTVSGPKAGTSAVRSVRVRDSKAVHRDLAELEKEVVEDLTGLLADELELQGGIDEARETDDPDREFDERLREASSSQDRAAERFERAMERLDDLLRRLAEDSLAEESSLFQKALARQVLDRAREEERQDRRQMEELAAMTDAPREDRRGELGFMSGRKEERVAQMEQALNLMQDAARYQNMEEAVKGGEDLLDRQRDLMDMLEKMSGELSPGDARAMTEALREIARMMNELMETLSSMQDQFPEDFVNADSMQDLPFQDLAEMLKEMAQALSRGDLAGAKAKAEQLLRAMSELVERMRDAARKVQDLARKGAEDFQRKRVNELQKLVEEQQALLQQTETVNEVVEGRSSRGRQETARMFAEALGEGLERISRRIRDLAREAGEAGVTPEDTRAQQALRRDLEALRGATGRGRRDLALQSLSRLDESARALPAGRPSAPALADDLAEARAAIASVPEAPRVPPTPQEAAVLRDLAGRQGELRGRTGKLAETIGTLAKAFPVISPDLPRSLEEAAGFMGEAVPPLQEGMPGQAVPPEREALYRLLKAQQSANQSAQAMAAMSGMRQGGGQGGSGLDELLGLIPGMASSGGRNQREGGRRGISVRNFRLPGSQDFEVPRAFREEVMESLRSGYPPGFEKAIRDYFRSITQ